MQIWVVSNIGTTQPQEVLFTRLNGEMFAIDDLKWLSAGMTVDR